MPLTPPRKAGLRAGREMQVEPCEIPFAGAPEIPCRERIYAFPTVLPYAATTKDEGNAVDACLPVGRGVFQQPVKSSIRCSSPFVLEEILNSKRLPARSRFGEGRRKSTLKFNLAFIRMPESKEEVYEDLYQRDQRE